MLASVFGPDDVLARYPSLAVAEWYRRLARLCENQGGVLAPKTLRLWLDNRDSTAKKVIAPHSNLTNSSVVKEVVAYHRSVYLTEKKARLGGGTEKWAGVIPRLQGAGYPKWDGKGQLSMNYQSLAAYSLMQTASFGVASMSTADADVFTSFHNFQVRTDVVVTLDKTPDNRTTLKFQRVQARAIDRYDWDPSRHLTMPNPDYGSKASWAIRPDLQRITVFHTNAKRIEADGLAAPYSLETEPWNIADPTILAPAAIDPTRKL